MLRLTIAPEPRAYRQRAAVEVPVLARKRTMVLDYFRAREGRLVTADALLDEFWSLRADPGNARKAVQYVRAYLRDYEPGWRITTVLGQGWRFERGE